MCGFIGTTNKHLAHIMLKKQEHRGPDALSFWGDAKIHLGHALLDITGAGQKQPIVTDKGNIVMLNGEMYDSRIPNDTVWLGKMLDKYGTSAVSYTHLTLPTTPYV